MNRDTAPAAEIHLAHQERRLLDASTQPPMDLMTAYAVQRKLTALRVQDGAAVIGWKLGYTSTAMRRQMNIDEPNYGPLLDVMLVRGKRLPNRFVQPRVEPEIALLLGSDRQVVQARAALEVVDSIWWDYRFTLELNTADGSSAAGVVLGDELPLNALDTLTVEMSRNGTTVGRATGAAAMGHPMRAFRWLSQTLGSHGDALRPGQLIITGGLTAAVPISNGDLIDATFGSGQRVRIRGSAVSGGASRSGPMRSR